VATVRTQSLRVVPPLWKHARDPRARIQAAIAYKIVQAHRKVRASGRGFLGKAAVLTGSFIKRAVSFEPKRVVIPTVAAKDPTARKALLAIQTAFRAAASKWAPTCVNAGFQRSRHAFRQKVLRQIQHLLPHLTHFLRKRLDGYS
jgi:hypothetical protein